MAEHCLLFIKVMLIMQLLNGTSFLFSRMHRFWISSNTAFARFLRRWTTDGSVSGTLVVPGTTNLPYGGAYVKYPTPCNGEVYFKACPGYVCGLYSFNGGTAAPNIRQVMAPDVEGSADTSPSYLVCYQNKYVVFAGATTGTVGNEIVAYDTIGDSAIEIDVNAGVASSMPVYLTVWKDAIYFMATDAGMETSLWATNLTNTWLAIDNITSTGAYFPRPVLTSEYSYTLTQDYLYFISVRSILTLAEF